MFEKNVSMKEIRKQNFSVKKKKIDDWGKTLIWGNKKMRATIAPISWQLFYDRFQ